MPEPVKIFTGATSKVPEGTTHEYACTLVDEKGADIQYAAIASATAWLHDVDTKTPINRIAQNVKDANGGVLAAGAGGVAVFTLTLDPADARVVNRAKEEEQHRLTLRFTYNRGGALSPGELTHEVRYPVVNLHVIVS